MKSFDTKYRGEHIEGSGKVSSCVNYCRKMSLPWAMLLIKINTE